MSGFFGFLDFFVFGLFLLVIFGRFLLVDRCQRMEKERRRKDWDSWIKFSVNDILTRVISNDILTSLLNFSLMIFIKLTHLIHLSINNDFLFFISINTTHFEWYNIRVDLTIRCKITVKNKWSQKEEKEKKKPSKRQNKKWLNNSHLRPPHY